MIVGITGNAGILSLPQKAYNFKAVPQELFNCLFIVGANKAVILNVYAAAVERRWS